MFDVCVIGHVARDLNVIAGVERPPSPGGAAYYSSMAYRSLGLRTLVVTKVAAADEGPLLADLRGAGAEVINLPTPRSTVFRNIDAPDAGGRVQKVAAIADPIHSGDVPDVSAGLWQLGPLTSRDLDPALASRCARAGGLVGIDVQGLTRIVQDGEVRPHGPESLPDDLSLIDVLKADEDEILTFTGETDLAAAVARVRGAGVAEILITRASRGSTIHGPRGSSEIAAVTPRPKVDPTGCGDTYLAAYLAARLESQDLRSCGLLASTAAALKMESFGPLRAGRAEILARVQADHRRTGRP
jgi:sugar/nucleoside kinase (ribokinase family)